MAATVKHKTEKWMKENSFDIYEGLQMKDILIVQMDFKNKYANDILNRIRSNSSNDITIKTALGFSIIARYEVSMKRRRGILQKNWHYYDFYIDRDYR